jgi:uncharacterized protein
MIRILLACIGLMICSAQAWAIDDVEYDKAVAAAWRDWIRASYLGLNNTVQYIPPAMQKLCANPGDSTLKDARRTFYEAVRWWARVQYFTPGPVSEHQRAFRIEYWPDKRNVVGRQLDVVLAKQDPTSLEPERFAATSVGVQGLPALERLLFDDDALAMLASDAPGREFRCALLERIGENLVSIADALVQEWTPEQLRFRGEPGPSSAEDEAPVTGRDVAARLLNDLLTATIAMRDMKLLAPLGSSLEKAKPQAAEYWRSRASLVALDENLETLRQAFGAKDGLIDLLAKQPDGLQASRALSSALNEAIRLNTSIGATSPDQIYPSLYRDVPLSEAVADPVRRKSVEALAEHLAKIRDLIAGPVATKLNLPIGFNALDGD